MSLFVSLLVFITLLYRRASLRLFTLAVAIGLLLVSRLSQLSLAALIFWWTLFIAIGIVLHFRGLRRKLITRHLLLIYQRIMPRMSQTEKVAIDAGTVGFEGELFRGQIDWHKHFNTPLAVLTEAEQAFLDGPVDALCRQINDWDITHQHHDLPASMWDFLKTEGFFGLIIPTNYGGKGFSAFAHSEILLRIYSRSTTVATTVAVPNSLGPAELLLHYGTEAQKDYYLPRLARGEDLPCFALTGPEAGSDAGAIPDYGIVTEGEFEGETVLGIRLNWNKRYITLAPVATVLGLAFKLFDPDQRLSPQTERGITCALIPVQTPGVTIGRRHMPLAVPFQNGPTQGNDVFIPLSFIIGGEAMIGHGWRMLVECLSAGRAITLPTSAISASKMFVAVSGAYARIRRQFNTAIGNFEGIQEPLSRLASSAYLYDAARRLSLSAIDRGEKPAVVSAIMKYHATEAGRQAACDAMDIHGGKGICLGPNNYLGNFYQGAPIAITVEGANILTRNMIIFGQGAIRCHPYALAELQAAQLTDPKQSLALFDQALFSHLGYSLSNIARSLLLSLSCGHVALKTPGQGLVKRYSQKITRLSANFALASDIIMLTVGAELKRKESLSARLGDVFSQLYLAAATLKLFVADGSPEEDRPLVQYSCDLLLHRGEEQLAALLKNLRPRLLGIALYGLIFPLGKQQPAPLDSLQQQVAHLTLAPNASRTRLTRGIDHSVDLQNPIHLLQTTLMAVIQSEATEKRVHQAIREGRISGWHYDEHIDAAANIGLITQDEAQSLRKLSELRQRVIAVDDFDTAAFH